MKLNSLHEDGHFDVIKHHPGKMGDSGKKKEEKGNMSILVDPRDRERFLKAMMPQ